MELVAQRYLVRTVGFFKRLIAFIFDIFVLNLVVVFPFRALLKPYEQIGFWFKPYDPLLYVLIIVIALFALLYFVLMELFVQQTIGMMVVQIYVEGELTFWKCLVRNAYLIPLFPLSLMIIIDPLFLIFKKERLSEKLTKTSTVEYHAML
jgi:hypothetical protein